MSRLVVEDADICDFATAIVSIDADAAAPASPRGPTDTTQLRAAVEALVIEADDSEVARLEAAATAESPDDLDEHFWGPGPDSVTAVKAVFADLSDQFAQRQQPAANGISRDDAAELLGITAQSVTAIIANTRAMQAAIELADQISDEAILAMHYALMHENEPSIAGKWRTEQVWVGGGNFGPRGADFIAPHQDRVPGAIDDLVRFAKRSDIAVLPQIAIAHAQFETIHPFPDGNGRTGRASAQSMLRNKRLTRQVTVPVSAGLLTDTNSYFQALTAYREGDPAPIVKRMSAASILAVLNGDI